VDANKNDTTVDRLVVPTVLSIVGEESLVSWIKMAKPGKLRTRKSTLGASRQERISSKQTVGSKSVYCSAKSKAQNRLESDQNRVGGILVERRQDPVPRSITTGFGNNGNRACTAATDDTSHRDPPPSSDCVDGNIQQPRSQSISEPKTSVGGKQDPKQPRGTQKSTRKDYIDRIEVVPMRTNDNQPFVRIFVGRDVLKSSQEEIPQKAPKVVKQGVAKEDGNKTKMLTSSTAHVPSCLSTAYVPSCSSTAYVPSCPYTEHVPSCPYTAHVPSRSSRARVPSILQTIDATQLGLCGHSVSCTPSSFKAIDTTCGHSMSCTPSSLKTIDTTKLAFCGISSSCGSPGLNSVDEKLKLFGHNAWHAPHASELGVCGDATRYASTLSERIDATKLIETTKLIEATRLIDTTKLDACNDFHELDQVESVINVMGTCPFESTPCIESERQRKDNTMNVLFDHIGKSLGESNAIAKSEMLRMEKVATNNARGIVSAQKKPSSKTMILSLGIVGRGKEKKNKGSHSMKVQRYQASEELVSREFKNSTSRKNVRFRRNKYDDPSDDSWTSSSSDSDSDSDCDSDISNGIIEQMMASLASKDKGAPTSTSFISETDESYLMEFRDDDVYMIRHDTSEERLSMDTTILRENEANDDREREPNARVMFGIGNAFGFAKKKRQDERDMRIVDSDILSSYDYEESYDSDDCTMSSF